jgi:hypothetical protein
MIENAFGCGFAAFGDAFCFRKTAVDIVASDELHGKRQCGAALQAPEISQSGKLGATLENMIKVPPGQD